MAYQNYRLQNNETTAAEAGLEALGGPVISDESNLIEDMQTNVDYMRTVFHIIDDPNSSIPTPTLDKEELNQHQ